MSTSSVLDLDKKWFMVPLPLRTCSLKDIANAVVSREKMDEYYQEAQAILDEERKQCQMDRGRWYSSQFLDRGTTADKIASAAVKLTDTDFMFFMDSFNLLFDTARTDAHHYEAALKALAAVWPKLFPPRPLKRFVTQYFATLPTEEKARKRVLVYWYLEDYLKHTYAQFLSLCEAMLKDRLAQRREAWLNVVGKLLCSIAEARSVAMTIMINKLGDPNAQVAHNAYHHLLKLLSESSTHQSLLFVELEKIIFTKNCPLRTMRYAANIMNQLVFSKEERKLALKSVQMYLALFRQLVLTGNVDSTVTTAIVVGLRRAFPYAGTDIAPLQEHLNALFVLASTGNFQQRTATLSLLQLLALGKGAGESFQSRWYRSLYRLLLVSPKLVPQSAQLSNFFTLLHKAMRADKNVERIAAFVHRLLQRAVYFNDAVVCAVLLLIGEMANAHHCVRQLIRGPRATPSRGAAEQRASAPDVPYDPKSREPQFAHARSECLWSLHLLTRHSHPSVVKLAVLLLFGEEIVFDTHPLDDMTLLNFLQMFVDARRKDKSETKGGSSEGSHTGMSIFHRATHTPNIPSASDAYFINASAQEIDVAALFLHRYAVQRQRFLNGLAQVRSTWGDTSGEADVAVRVGALDAALFGPAGKLADPMDSKDVADTNTKAPSSTVKAKPKPADKATITGSAGGQENVGWSDNSKKREENTHDAVGLGEDFNVEGSDDDLEWGSANEDGGDIGTDDDEDSLGCYDADEAEENVLGVDRHRDEDDDGDDFGEMIESHKKEVSRKRKREEEWLNRRVALNSTRIPRQKQLTIKRRNK